MRLHKTINPVQIEAASEAEKMPNLFDGILYNGKPLEDFNIVAKRTNPNWPDYENDICIETFGFDVSVSSQYDVPNIIVLRATLSCCCAEFCVYPGHDYSKGGVFKTANRAPKMPMLGNPQQILHPPGTDYVEAVIDINTLKPLMLECESKLDSKEQRITFASEIKTEADALTLTAEELEGQLGLVGIDQHGLLMGAGSAAKVLAGEDTDKTDYFWVATYIILFQRLLADAHRKLTTDWPQRSQYNIRKY